MSINFDKLKRAKCVDCGIDLSINDYICCIDPFSASDRERPKRTNLCQKCYNQRKEKKDKLLSDEEKILTSEEIMKEIQDEINNLPEEQKPKSNKSKKKKKLKKRIRKELIKRYEEQKSKNLVKE